MTLVERQQRFAELVGKLLTQAYTMGYQVTLDECYRPPELAALYASQGRGIKNSLHCDRLAIDINLWKDGAYLESTADYEPLGQWWEGQEPYCTWGGRFNDARHYAYSDGVRR